jgi:hypothetical protein
LPFCYSYTFLMNLLVYILRFPAFVMNHTKMNELFQLCEAQFLYILL